MVQDLIEDKSTLAQVMAWCHRMLAAGLSQDVAHTGTHKQILI